MQHRVIFFLAQTILILFLTSGCATPRVQECDQIAGPGWKALSSPPPNAKDLLRLDSVPDSRELIWLSKGEQNLLVCDYSNGLIIPGCSGSTAYAFEKRDGIWIARGQLLDACNSDVDPK